jgi:hypothetical protein
MNQSVTMTTAANTQNSRTGCIWNTSQVMPRSAKSVREVRAIVVPTLRSPSPIRTGTEWLKGMEKTAFVRVDMFSTPTMITTKGSVYVGRTVCPLLQPQPFQPSSARTLNDMTAEQQSCTTPVNASPKREWTLEALESCARRRPRSPR